MSLVPDPSALVDVASRISLHAEALREHANRLARSIDAVRWRGVAAEAFHASAHVALGNLRHAAGRLDTTAATLRRHAQRVREAERDIGNLLDDFGTWAKDLVSEPMSVPADFGRVINDAVGVVGDMAGM